MIHLDTNVLIAIAGGMPAILDKVSSLLGKKKDLAVSTVTWSEFCNGPLSTSDVTRAKAILNGFFIPFSRPQAEISAKLFNSTGRRRRSAGDCMIAASAIESKSSLLTINTKDFTRFVSQGLELEPFN